MKPADEKNESLSETILSEAQAEAEQILAEARVKADAIRQQAEERAAVERKAILDRGAQEVARLRGQAAATAQLKARSMELEHREKLLNQAFTLARDQLRAEAGRPDYALVARRLLEEAAALLHASSVKVHADPITRSALPAQVIEEISREHQVEIHLDEAAGQNPGIIVETADGHMTFDNTLETRLERMQSALRFTVYQLLMGERS